MKNNTTLDIISLLSNDTLGIMMSGDDALREHIMTSMKTKALEMHKAPITQGKGADKRKFRPKHPIWFMYRVA